MSNPYGSNELKLHKAAELSKAGKKDEARHLLRDILSADQNNLEAWELLAYEAQNKQEELHCLERILSLRPDHPWAKNRLAEIDAASSKPGRPTREKRSSKKRRSLSPVLMGMAMVIGILALGFILIRFGFQPTNSSAQQTLTSVANNSALCQELIARALEASGTYCNQFGSNNVCYGNKTLLAELIPEASQRFSERGDIVGVDSLKRLSVSPLNLDTQEWGIAIFKVMANLPRSLPGETVTVMVFGNTTIDNQSQNLETFYFSSGLGEIICEQVPYDGIMISMPDGTGIKFVVNNAELILMGNASLSAVQNGDMDVKLFSGSGQITSEGETQVFGAGEQVSVTLGGPTGMEAVTVPSAPVPISPDDLVLSCTLTGEFCTEEDLLPISEDEAELTLESGFQYTPTPQPTPTKSSTVSNTPSISPSSWLFNTWTRTPTSTRTRTFTLTPTSTNTSTLTPTFTPTIEATGTYTYTPDPICPLTAGGLGIEDPKTLSMSITNNGAVTATISGITINWVEISNQRMGEVRLESMKITNMNDPDTPSIIPDEIAWFGSIDDRSIPAGDTKTLTIFFVLNLEPSGYDVTVSFGPDCQVSGSR